MYSTTFYIFVCVFLILLEFLRSLCLCGTLNYASCFDGLFFFFYIYDHEVQLRRFEVYGSSFVFMVIVIRMDELWFPSYYDQL